MNAPHLGLHHERAVPFDPHGELWAAVVDPDNPIRSSELSPSLRLDIPKRTTKPKSTFDAESLRASLPYGQQERPSCVARPTFSPNIPLPTSSPMPLSLPSMMPPSKGPSPTPSSHPSHFALCPKRTPLDVELLRNELYLEEEEHKRTRRHLELMKKLVNGFCDLHAERTKTYYRNKQRVHEK